MKGIKPYKFSIIIVVYNAVGTLEDTLRSVLGQSYTNIELIIIDGMSTDGSLDIINRYSHQIDVIQSEKDNGVYDAMNKGLQFVTGDFIFFLGADDIFYNHQVLESLSHYIDDPQSVYYGNVMYNKSKKLYDGQFSTLKIATKNICHQSIFYPSQILKNELFDLKYKLKADYEMNLRLWAKYTFIYLNLVVVVYNEDGLSGTNKDYEFEKDLPQITLKNLGIIFYFYRIGRNFSRKIRNE